MCCGPWNSKESDTTEQRFSLFKYIYAYVPALATGGTFNLFLVCFFFSVFLSLVGLLQETRPS